MCEAKEHCQQVHAHLVEAGLVATRHVQADELWVKLIGLKVWQAMALASRLWLGGMISTVRDQALITRLVAWVRASLASLDGRTLAVAAGLVVDRCTLGDLFSDRVPLPAWVPPKRWDGPRAARTIPNR